MLFKKFVILGGGPSGLSIARTLLDHGEDSFVVLEKESEPGGLCRSLDVDGAPIDSGGGHILDVKHTEVTQMLFRFLPREEWRLFKRISRIRLCGIEIDYPLEAHLWQLPLLEQVEFLESIARAGCVAGTPMPDSFSDWIIWKLGERIASQYMLPYNRKLWSCDLDELGVYWLEKLPNVSFRDTLTGCISKEFHGTIPAHGEFLYPARYGYGEVWRRMGQSLGDKLLLDTPVTSIDWERRTVNNNYQAGIIISTIPWPVWLTIAEMPERIADKIRRLRHVSIDVDYVPESPGTEAHWVYEPDESLAYHRILCRQNFSGGTGYWTETNSTRAVETKGWRYRNDYAYPVNTIQKPTIMKELLRWCQDNGIKGAGRWGRWEHLNSDVAVLEGIMMARNMIHCGCGI